MQANTGIPYELIVQSIFQEILDQNEKRYLAEALNLATGSLLNGVAARKSNALFRDLPLVLRPAIQLGGIPSCLWWSITLPFITPRPWSNGWLPTHG
jgi:hypothetical protein